MLSVVPAVALLLAIQAGVLALLAFVAVVVFVIFAYLSLSRHLRRSRRPWPGEPGYHDDTHSDPS